MYKAIASFFPKSSPNKTATSVETTMNEEAWVIVSSTESSGMANSWILSPPLIKTDEPSENIHRFNPIENLLIEHASMSVYEQIAPKTRNRRQKKTLNDNKLDEPTVEDDGGEEEDDQTSFNHQPANSTSIDHQNQSSTTTLDSSTSSLVAHHRHLNRLHQRRKRSKLILDEPKQVLNKNLDRARLRPLQPSTRANPS